MRWIRKAAEHGSVTAQYALGNMYINGKIVQQDLMEGLKWMAKAAAQGDERAGEILRHLTQG